MLDSFSKFFFCSIESSVYDLLSKKSPQSFYQIEVRGIWRKECMFFLLTSIRSYSSLEPTMIFFTYN